MRLPTPLRFLWDSWMSFSHLLGKITGTILLSILWIVGFGPYALLLKLGASLRPPRGTQDTFLPAISETPESLRYPF